MCVLLHEKVGLRKKSTAVLCAKGSRVPVIALQMEEPLQGAQSVDVGEKALSRSGKVQALLFARAQELAGVSEVTLEIQEGWTTANCFEAVVSKHPALKAISSCMMVALNHSYVTEPVAVKDGDELALIPPISGG